MEDRYEITCDSKVDYVFDVHTENGIIKFWAVLRLVYYTSN